MSGSPDDLAVDDVLRWVAPFLDGRRGRVLEVGCGPGDLARRLGASGLEVTALDQKLGDQGAAAGVRWVEADFLAFDDRPFDAVLFTRSLHHIDPLDRAVEQAAHLVAPGGLLLVDEFDREAPDADTARWYYEVQELLAAAAIYPSDRIEGGPDAEPLARWRAEHAHDPPLHTGAEMLAAIADRFTGLQTRRGAYLYRTIASRLEPTDRGAAVAERVHDAEFRRLRAAALAAVGLRIAAVAP
jgi:SAM-dependent methyltransferase